MKDHEAFLRERLATVQDRAEQSDDDKLRDLAESMLAGIDTPIPPSTYIEE